MALANLAKVLKIFGGSEPTTVDRADLAKEVMLMVLAHATAADARIKQIEVDTVRRILKTYTQTEFSGADIRMAASSVLFEKAPLDRFVSSASRKLDSTERLAIAYALKELVNSYDRVSDHEISFFNNIVNALDLTPAQLMGIEK